MDFGKIEIQEKNCSLIPRTDNQFCHSEQSEESSKIDESSTDCPADLSLVEDSSLSLH